MDTRRIHGRTPPEFPPAVLQATVTAGLALLFFVLHRRTRKPFFSWFSLAWALYAVRIGAIITFLRTESFAWLYWHKGRLWDSIAAHFMFNATSFILLAATA